MTVDLGFQVQAQYPGVVFLGGTQTQEVMFIGITTTGHLIYFEFPIPKNIYTEAEVRRQATGYTGTVEDIFTVPGVVGEQWIQQPSNGQLLSAMIITVQSDSGNSTGEVTVPFKKLDPAVVQKLVTPLIASLNASEGLGQ